MKASSIVLFSVSVVFSFSAMAQFSKKDVPEATQNRISEIMTELREVSDVKERLLRASEGFGGTPFEWGPCGEGSQGVYDNKPLTTFESFDCTTFAEAMLAFAYADRDSGDDLDSFMTTFLQIKYCAEEVCYPNRNHFTSLNWNKNILERLRWMKDITLELDADAIIREKYIDMESWYAQKAKDVEESKDSEELKKAKIAELELPSPNKDMHKLAKIHYIPLKKVLSKEIEEKIAQEGIVLVNFIRGEHTKVNIPVIVGHQAFVLDTADGLVVRQARSNVGILDLPLADYIEEISAYTTWPFRGIQVLNLVDKP